jgi:hypothetical protein
VKQNTNYVNYHENGEYGKNDRDVTRLTVYIQIEIANSQPNFLVRNGLAIFRFFPFAWSEALDVPKWSGCHWSPDSLDTT